MTVVGMNKDTWTTWLKDGGEGRVWLRDSEPKSHSGVPALPQVNPQLGWGWVDSVGNQCLTWCPQNNGKIFSYVLEDRGER